MEKKGEDISRSASKIYSKRDLIDPILGDLYF